MTVRQAALTALATGLLAAPAPAAGATIAVDHDCYVQSTPGQPSAIGANGSGYTPNATATVVLSGTTSSVPTDINGNFTTMLAAPATGLAHPGARQYSLTATDDTTAAAATTTVNVTRPGVDGVPSRSKPHARIMWNIAGFPGQKAIYGHWRFGGKTRSNHRMGRPQGPCGVLHARARQIEAKRIRFGMWTVQFDFNRTFDRFAAPRASLKIRVTKTFG